MRNENEIGSLKATATINLLAGIWLFVSPWVYGAYTEANAWNGWIVGALVVLFAAIRLSDQVHTQWASVLNLLLGAWTFFSPWIYGYAGHTGRFINSLVVGVIVFVLGIYGSSVGKDISTTSAPMAHR